MRKLFITVICAISVFGCARYINEGANTANERYFDAWMSLNYPDAKPSGLGIYVIEEEVGIGKEVLDSGFAIVNYTLTDLEGKILSYTTEEVAQQLGEYSEINYYGPEVTLLNAGYMEAGVREILVGMREGGKKKAIIPGWLLNTNVYDTEAEYLANAAKEDNGIYEFEVVEYTEDILEWQLGKIQSYFEKNSNIFGDMTIADSLSVVIDKEKVNFPGMFYKQLKAPADTTSFPSDTTVYINYIGRLLDGMVFDTNIERVAKDNGLYSSSKSYEPVSIQWGDNYSDLTMGDDQTETISGFTLTLWQMRAMEKGIGVFYSDYGYTYNGSGNSIPAYAPLVFEIELVEKPED